MYMWEICAGCINLMKKNLIGIAIACFYVCSFILYRNEFQGKPILLLPKGSNAATLLDENPDDEQYNSTLQERINHLKQYCKYHPNLYPNRKLVHQPLIDETLRVKYCWIEKVGSSFMKSFFRHFQNYTLARNTTLNRQTKHGSTDKDINRQQHKGDNYTRIMIVRDPFERLLSGYIDKFFLPSPIFWKKRGRYIVKHFRPNSSFKEQSCGHNVTFLEFIQYVVHVSTRDKNMEEPHFTPMHTHCKPCLIHYDYVWKMETIMPDFKHAIKHLINMKDLHIDGFDFRMDKEHLSSDVISRIAFMFERRYDIEKCITFYEACLRTWRGFQMRGVIDKNDKFPLISLPEDFNVTVYKDLVMKSSNAIKSKSKVKSQKKEVFLESYSILPVKLLEQLEGSVIKIDSEIFNYRKSLRILMQDYKRNNFSYFDFL